MSIVETSFGPVEARIFIGDTPREVLTALAAWLEDNDLPDIYVDHCEMRGGHGHWKAEIYYRYDRGEEGPDA